MKQRLSPRRGALALLLGVVLSALEAASAAEEAADPLSSSFLSGRILFIEGAGGNTAAYIGPGGVLLVDAKAASAYAAVQEVLKQYTDEPVRWVVNTHWHHDHTDGNAGFAEAGAVIIAHENLRPRLMTQQVIAPPMTGGVAPGMTPAAWPVVTYSETMTLRFEGEEVRLLYAPFAHTDGDTIVHFVRSDVIALGDIWFNGMYPNIDNGVGATVDAMIAALEAGRQLAGPSTKIVPGHGAVGNRDDLLRSIKMLRLVRERVQALIEAGASEEEAVAAAPLADIEADWAWYIDSARMVRHAYKSLTAK